MNIGTKLKNRRKELGLTLQEVADMIGVSNPTVSRWETGNINNMKRNYIEKYAKALQVSPLFIMGLDDINDKENLTAMAQMETNGEEIPVEMKYLSELFQLSQLYKTGLLTKEEFEIGKKFIMEMMSK